MHQITSSKDADLRHNVSMIHDKIKEKKKIFKSIIYSMTTTSCKLYPILPAVYPSKEYLPPFSSLPNNQIIKYSTYK